VVERNLQQHVPSVSTNDIPDLVCEAERFSVRLACTSYDEKLECGEFIATVAAVLCSGDGWLGVMT
jgi:hypothetical protein